MLGGKYEKTKKGNGGVGHNAWYTYIIVYGLCMKGDKGKDRGKNTKCD